MAVLVVSLQLLSAQAEGRAAFEAFQQWKAAPANTKLGFGDAIAAYRAKLKADGLSDARVDRTLILIAAYDEGKEYDKIYAGPPEFNVRLEIFRGFRILRYEDTTGRYDWGPETIRLVRLVAQKP